LSFFDDLDAFLSFLALVLVEVESVVAVLSVFVGCFFANAGTVKLVANRRERVSKVLRFMLVYCSFLFEYRERAFKRGVKGL
jgi:hypothetical protein